MIGRGRGRVERTYGSLIKYALVAINPFKKMVITTECNIHKFINRRAVEILKNDRFLDAYYFFSDHITDLNAGVVWADQDFKSMSHFYNPIKNRGLYGNKNALTLAVEYYNNALKHWEIGDIERSIFFLGASVHIVQDMTVPQHANIRLLDNHKQYETFIKRTYVNSPRYIAHRGGYYLDSIDEFVRCNARTAIRIYHKLKYIRDENRRFFTITKFTLPLAQKSTAGCLMRFYREVSKPDTAHHKGHISHLNGKKI